MSKLFVMYCTYPVVKLRGQLSNMVNACMLVFNMRWKNTMQYKREKLQRDYGRGGITKTRFQRFKSKGSNEKLILFRKTKIHLNALNYVFCLYLIYFLYY